MCSQYRFSPSTTKLLPERSGEFGLYLPVCAITSMKRFQVRVCPTSARARAIDFLVSSEVARLGTSLAARAASRAAIARVKSVCLIDHVGSGAEQPDGLVPVRAHCVSQTIAFAACIASEVAAGVPEITGAGGFKLAAVSVFRVCARIAASTGAFLV